MHSLELDVLEHIGQWLEAGQDCWLCTIVQTTGSSPRPVGTLLGTTGAATVGTLSGGCVEEDLLERLPEGNMGDRPTLVEYGIAPEDNERLGLPCGGRLSILVQKLIPDRDRTWVSQAVAAIGRRQLATRELDMATGETLLRTTEQHEPVSLGDGRLVQTFGPRMRMLLVGAGQLAQVLSSLALAMNFDVLVTDPRESVLDQWQGPDVPLIPGLPDDIVLERANDRHSLVITLTHDPRIDDMALLEALESNAWYVGALGSVRTTQERLKRLRQLGLSEDALARLHAPVGLPIGSKTPWEIAVAIMAEITQLLRSRVVDDVPTLT